MTYTPETQDEPTPVAKAETVARSIVSGSDVGAVRRIVLWVALAALIVATAYIPPVLFLAMVPLMLLALTDRLV